MIREVIFSPMLVVPLALAAIGGCDLTGERQSFSGADREEQRSPNEVLFVEGDWIEYRAPASANHSRTETARARGKGRIEVMRREGQRAVAIGTEATGDESEQSESIDVEETIPDQAMDELRELLREHDPRTSESDGRGRLPLDVPAMRLQGSIDGTEFSESFSRNGTVPEGRAAILSKLRDIAREHAPEA